MSTLSPSELQHRIDHLLSLRERWLTHRSVNDILASIDTVVARFLDPQSREYQEAEAILPKETGLSTAMIRHVLPLIFQEYRAERLQTFLQDELGDANALDTFVSRNGHTRKVFGPPLIIQVLAGNIPGAGLDGIIFALLVKAATVVKASSTAPGLPSLFARTLAEVDPDLGACVAVVTWQGGNTSLEDVAFSRANFVIASGSEQSLAAIRSRVHGQFIAYGHKISFALVTKESLTDAPTLARLAAYDILLFDQQGCLSPQLIYVEDGGAVSPREFAALLAQALAECEQQLPRGTIPPEASITIRRVRDESEWQALAGKDVVLHASPQGTAWTVIYDADPTFVPSSLYRTIRVKPLSSLSQLHELLIPWRSYLEAVGVAAHGPRLVQCAEMLGHAGVSRICPIGTMQLPPLSWRHGGRPRLADLVRWVEVEGA
ncbi:MAG: acyl-CoA reductase [Candidatus Binatia bacterium]